MHFLHECSQCGTLQQIDTSVWAQSKQMLACRSCGQTNIFGSVFEEVTSPSVELVAGQIGAADSTDNLQGANLQIYWECGVCHKASQFSSQNISNKGSKVTCNQCFHFILLRAIAPMPDMPMMDVQEIPTKAALKKAPTIDIDEKMIDHMDIINDDTTARVEKQDIVEVFTPPAQETSKEAVIRIGYADPKYPKPKADDEPTNETLITPIDVPNIDEIVSNPVDYQPPSIDHDQSDLESLEQNLEDENAGGPSLSNDLKSIAPHEIRQISQAYRNPEDTFMAYKEFKEDDSFDYSFDQDDLKEVAPDNHLPKMIKTVEHNMIKYCLIASGVILLLFAIFFFIRQHQAKKLRQKIEKENQQWIKQQEQERKNKPKYGFPEL